MTTSRYAGLAPNRWLLLWLSALGGACGAERGAHPDYGAKCEHGEIYKGFCLPRDAASDGAAPGPDGSTSSDAGSGGADAGMAEPCGKEDEVELCYEHEDRETALQPPCRAGTRTCKDGVWGRCVGQVTPIAESCNGSDDDCDGQSDEELVTSSCSVEGQAGSCAEGVFICVGGEDTCFQIQYAKLETCDAKGANEDCDNFEDHEDADLTRSCFDGPSGCTSDGQGGYTCQGICAPGTQRCVDGAFEATCSDDIEPKAEEQNGLDDDCDGSVDENFPCVPDQVYACYTGPAQTRNRPPCHEGTQLCVSTDAGTELGTCEDQQLPAPETCANNGTDNDCDGTPDDVPGLGQLCANTSSTNVCIANSTWRCMGSERQCAPGPAEPNEVCDGRDNNCNNVVDEGFNLQSDENHCGGCNIRCGAGLTCCGGTCVNTRFSNAHCGGCGAACGSGLSCCERNCVDTNTNGDHCGACGEDCDVLLPLIQTKCENGMCARLLGL